MIDRRSPASALAAESVQSIEIGETRGIEIATSECRVIGAVPVGAIDAHGRLAARIVVHERVGPLPDHLVIARHSKFTLPKIRVDRARIRRWSGRCLRLVVLLLAVWALSQWKPWNYAAGLFARQEPAPAAVIDNAAKLQKLLEDAGTALMRNRQVDPPGHNALELYRAALMLAPDNDVAQVGIDSVADKLLAVAERALQKRDLPELASAIDAARSARPDHPRLQYYSLKLQRERERMFGPGKPR